MDGAALARVCAEAIWADDSASKQFGIQLISIEPGHAVLAMTVDERMVNGHNICHGGFIFLLADSAFAYASNTYNRRTVAQHCEITYLNPARIGDRLTARAVERQWVGRTGLFDITVNRADGLPVAEFRGHSRTIKGELIPGLKAD
ncbi:MAG: hydroxyphenylacetyl-CoA thioesterase PaaI [Pseudorhodoplanes sp.]|nr:hydroxyphenylacetyl-CoA thioesterase PaaI [Pseudorhodoplanes sp.]